MGVTGLTTRGREGGGAGGETVDEGGGEETSLNTWIAGSSCEHLESKVATAKPSKHAP